MAELPLELVETDNAFLVKYRTFVPEDKAEMLFKSFPHAAEHFEDCFYDILFNDTNKWTAEYGGAGGYRRQRKCISTGSERWVQQDTVPNGFNSHMYVEREFSRKQAVALGLDHLVAYQFKRIVLFHDIIDGNVYSVVLDKVISDGLNYAVLSFSCSFNKTKWGDIVDIGRVWISEQVNSRKLRPLPVYSKFMYALRLSRNYAVFHDVFEEQCTAHSVEEQVERLLTLQRLTDKEYIWVNDQAPGIFESCLAMGWDRERTMGYLQGRRGEMLGDCHIRFLPVDCF
jgi:hypothetical protein